MEKVIEKNSTSSGAISAEGMTQSELIASFADFSQTDIPTRTELKTLKSSEIKRKHRIAMIPKHVTASQRRGNNLNSIVIKADKLWKKSLMPARGVILRHVGCLYDEEITALANLVECPQMVVDYFINHGEKL